MKKIVTIGATAMMGFTALGGFQGVAQAMENSSLGLVSTFAQHVLGDTVHADTVIDEATVAEQVANLFTDDTYSAIKSDTYRANIQSAYDQVSALANSQVKTDLLEKIDLVLCMHPGAQHLYEEAGLTNFTNVVDAAKQIFTDDGDVKDGFDKSAVKAFGAILIKQYNPNTYSSVANSPKFLAAIQKFENYEGPAQQQGQTDVVFDHTETPGEPGWYGVVPATITFTDDNKDQALDATVKIVNADDQTTDYTGSKIVDVKVKSTNGFDLKDGAKETVEYSITKKDGTAVSKNTDEQELGMLDKTTPTIASKATLKGEAQESGKFVDTLNYHFVEQ